MVQPSSQTDAFPRLDKGCYRGVQTLSWRFSGPGWTAPRATDVRAGFSSWNGVRNRYNNVFINSVESSFGIPVTTNAGENSTLCSSNGTPTEIRIDSGDFERTATHEAGHAHGLSHSGNDDSLFGTSSTPPNVP